MIRLISILLMFLFSEAAFASNMGNGPAAVNVWIIGSIVAFCIALGKAGQPKDSDKTVNWNLFFTLLMIQLLVVFCLGIAAIFVFM